MKKEVKIVIVCLCTVATLAIVGIGISVLTGSTVGFKEGKVENNQSGNSEVVETQIETQTKTQVETQTETKVVTQVETQTETQVETEKQTVIEEEKTVAKEEVAPVEVVAPVKKSTASYSSTDTYKNWCMSYDDKQSIESIWGGTVEELANIAKNNTELRHQLWKNNITVTGVVTEYDAMTMAYDTDPVTSRVTCSIPGFHCVIYIPLGTVYNIGDTITLKGYLVGITTTVASIATCAVAD